MMWKTAQLSVSQLLLPDKKNEKIKYKKADMALPASAKVGLSYNCPNAPDRCPTNQEDK